MDAHKRGVQVQVILDKSQRSDKYSSADFLANQGLPVMIDANHAYDATAAIRLGRADRADYSDRDP